MAYMLCLTACTFDPDGGVNSAKVSSVDKHIKLAPVVQCMHRYILRPFYRQPIDWSIAIATKNVD
jgi:hypothetical protein